MSKKKKESRKKLEKEYNHAYSRFKLSIGLLIFFVSFSLITGVNRTPLFYSGLVLVCFSLSMAIIEMIKIKKKVGGKK